MSLIKDLLGLSNFTLSENNISSLKQGQKFTNMQTQISQSVLPQLPLISKSSGNNILSVIEGFESKNSKSPTLSKTAKNESEIIKANKDLANLQNTIAETINKNKSNNDKFMNIKNAKFWEPSSLPEMDTLKKKLVDYNNFNYDGLTKQINPRINTLSKKMPVLDSKQQEIQKLKTAGNTLKGELEDNTLQMNAQYLRYFVWFVSALTLGLVAVKKASN